MVNYDIGCGYSKKEGYIRVDNDKGYDPEILMDIDKEWTLPINSAENISIENVIEHINSSITHVIKESKKTLKPNGILTLKAPNCYFWKNRIKFLFGRFKAEQGYHYDHRWILKPSFIKELLEYQGFEVLTEVNDLFDREIDIKARKRL